MLAVSGGWPNNYGAGRFSAARHVGPSQLMSAERHAASAVILETHGSAALTFCSS